MSKEYIIKRKARVIMDQRLVLGNDSRYIAFLKVYGVRKSQKFPDGVKAKFVLIDTVTNSTRLLIDNHEPFGFHVHSKSDKGVTNRIRLGATDYQAALRLFQTEVERILKNEKK